MRGYSMAGSIALGVALLAGSAQADPKFPQGEARRSMGNLAPKTPQYRNNSPSAGHSHYDHYCPPQPVYPRYSYRSPYRSSRRYYSPYDYGYDPYGYRYTYPYSTYSYRRYYYNAQPFVPAGLLFGPQAMQRFMGIGGNVVQPNANLLGANGLNRQPVPVPAPVPPVNAAPANLPAPNGNALASAWKYIGFGDAHFQNQKYTDAHLRYRKAAQAAPQLADAHFRQGYALIGMQRYEAAAKAIKRGLLLDPDWPGSQFNDNELYGDQEDEKAKHVEAMVAASKKEPRNSDLQFLLGVYLYMDRDHEPARVFLQRAAQLAGVQDAHIRAFLNR